MLISKTRCSTLHRILTTRLKWNVMKLLSKWHLSSCSIVLLDLFMRLLMMTMNFHRIVKEWLMKSTLFHLIDFRLLNFLSESQKSILIILKITFCNSQVWFYSITSFRIYFQFQLIRMNFLKSKRTKLIRLIRKI